MAGEPQHLPVTYNEVHNIIRRSAKEIAEFNPNLIVAIGRHDSTSLISGIS
jgi:hypoxanthine phosphoribosyltransferase